MKMRQKEINAIYIKKIIIINYVGKMLTNKYSKIPSFLFLKNNLLIKFNQGNVLMKVKNIKKIKL